MQRISLTTWILLGLALGVAVGIFFGERAEMLNPIGNGFIRLLQMAVLPYFIVALPLGFARLTYEEAKKTGFQLAMFSLLLWGLGILLVVLLPLTFPALTSANFFSSSSVAPAQEVDFVELYIPANPFSSLSQAIIPGVVVFGIAVGLALIGVPNKEQLLVVLDSLANALGRITGFVVKLTPIGVFALAASAAGTMTLEDLSRLQVYLITYTVGALLLTFWLLPMLVASLTPFTYGDILRVTRDPLVTGFTTGNLLVVLAMLADNCKHLFNQQDEESRQHAESVVDVTLPIAFTFPNVGVVLLLLFVPFAGWFTGNPVPWSEYPKLSVLGFFSFFGSVEIGLPFLLQQLRIPSDMFRLHVVTLVFIGRLATLLAVMHLAGLALMTATGNAGWLKFRPRRLATFAVVSIAILAAGIGGTRLVLQATVDQTYSRGEVLGRMEAIHFPIRGQVYHEMPEPLEIEPGQSPLDAIRARGVLRVGYDADGLPFSFFNDQDELVGFDIELTQALANDLNVEVEYYPFRKRYMADHLSVDRRYDLLTGGLIISPERMETMRYCDPYLDLHLSFVVPDHRKSEFTSIGAMRRQKSLRIAVLNRPCFAERAQQSLPLAEFVQLESPREYFEEEHDFDALVMSAEGGSTWTLLHPHFSVVIPEDHVLVTSVGYLLPTEADRLESFVSRWIDLRRKDGTIDTLFQHWIEGKSAEASQPRWNVMANVLGWGQPTTEMNTAQRSED